MTRACNPNLTPMRSESLPVGESHFGVFFGGIGGQSEVEVGIAQHDASFKWLLSLSADGKRFSAVRWLPCAG